jgi:hypothetical protein
MILFVLKKKLMKKRVLKDLGGFWRFWFLLWGFSDIKTCFGEIIWLENIV